MIDLMNPAATTLASQDIVSQTKLAFSHRLPLAIGATIGSIVPIGTFTVGHAEIAGAGWLSIPGAIVAGGLLFSAITVYKWSERAFASGLKALGFVVLSEGIMSFSTTPWLSILMLCMLVAVNAVANGANLALQYVETQRRIAAQAQATASTVASAPAHTTSAIEPPIRSRWARVGNQVSVRSPRAPRQSATPSAHPTIH